MVKLNKIAKAIMILGAGEAQIPLIQKSIELNLYTIVVDYDKNAPGFKFANKNILISTLDKKNILKAATKHKINGIITMSDLPVRSVAYVCEKLGLNGLSINAAQICTNKHLLRVCMQKNNILTPTFLKITTDNEIKNIKINYPVIIKPVDSSASRGVKKIYSADELKTAYFEAFKYSKCGDVIIEKFIEGPEYSIEALCYDDKIYIIAITEKITHGYKNVYFVEDRHIIPASISSEKEKKIRITVINAIKKIGLNSCAVHAEIKYSINGPVIIEIGARLGGDYITSDLVPLSTGVNIHEQAINICLNKKINITPSLSNFAGVQFINSNKYYLLKKHLKIIKSNKAFIRSEIKSYKRVSLKNSNNRLGFFICKSNKRSTLIGLLDS